jgi:hypothetical protein
MYTTIVKTHCNLGYTKITNSDSFGNFENVYCSLFSDLHFCHFYIDQVTTYFVLKFYRLVVYITNYMQIFFRFFLKLQNMIFKFSNKTSYM